MKDLLLLLMLFMQWRQRNVVVFTTNFITIAITLVCYNFFHNFFVYNFFFLHNKDRFSLPLLLLLLYFLHIMVVVFNYDFFVFDVVVVVVVVVVLVVKYGCRRRRIWDLTTALLLLVVVLLWLLVAIATTPAATATAATTTAAATTRITATAAVAHVGKVWLMFVKLRRCACILLALLRNIDSLRYQYTIDGLSLKRVESVAGY
jgi:hypothetical protein